MSLLHINFFEELGRKMLSGDLSNGSSGSI